MGSSEPFVTYLELRESTAAGEAGAGLSHKAAGLVLLHVLELAAHGEPRGAVTIVHDAGEHGARYLPLARSLAQAGWSIALPDLRGHGRSEGERGHSAGINEVVRDIGDIQDHLAYRQPETPRVLIGQGLGALYCLAYACERPDGVAGLVLSAPLLEPAFIPPEAGKGLAKLFRKVGPTTPGRIGWSSEQMTSDAAEMRARRGDPLVHDVITARAGAQAREAASQYRPKVGGLPMPVLVLQGSKDPIARSDATRAIAGGKVEVQVLEGLLHDLFHETCAPEVVQLVAAWLESRLPR